MQKYADKWLKQINIRKWLPTLSKLYIIVIGIFMKDHKLIGRFKLL